MKKNLILIVSFALITFTGFTQVQATLKPGSQPNSVYVTFKSAVTINAAKFSSFQFAVGIPASVSAGIVASVTSLDPLVAYVQLNSTETQGISYSVYSFSGDGAQSGTGTTFTLGVEYNYAEVFFTGGNITLNDVRIMQVPNGGTSSQVNFYVADKGTDITNVAAQFYSSTPANVTNDGNGYTGSSFAKIGSVILPVKFLGFNVTRKNNDAVLTWQIENETSLTDRYEIERSVNGVDFRKVNTVKPKHNGNSGNSYELTDLNLASIRSSGIIYYRIKQVDKDGNFIYSEIKNVRLNSKGIAIGVYPNPVKNYANLSIDLEQDAIATITINDAAGKQMQNIQMQLFKGMNNKQINMGGIAAGSYMLKVQTATETKTIPIVKAN